METQIVETTFGDLVELITQIAMKAGDSEREGYELASMAVGDLLGHSKDHDKWETEFAV